MEFPKPVAPKEQLPVGDSYVTKQGIYVTSAYLIVLFSTLGYFLVALWPGNPPLVIMSVRPNYGPMKGNADVDIVGTGFTEGLQVYFGDVRARAVTRKSDNLLTVTTPPEVKAGFLTIEIDAPNGEKANLTNGFRSDSESSQDKAEAASVFTEASPAQNVLDSSMTNCRRTSLPLFAWACTLRSNVRLLLIVIVVGALGSLIHVLRSFYWYVGNRSLKASWLLMYCLLPFNGAGLGLLFFLITRGLSSPPPASIQASPDGYAALAALVGMFSQQALMKTKQIAESLFAVAEKGYDQAISHLVPKVSAIQPNQGPPTGGTEVVISGVNLSSTARVAFGGVPTTTLVVHDDKNITVVTPAHGEGKVDVEIVTMTGQRSSISGVFTYVNPSI